MSAFLLCLAVGADQTGFNEFSGIGNCTCGRTDCLFWNSAVALLLAVFFLLLTSWALWWWLVGESRDIRWMRNWSAAAFVMMAAVACFGAGAMLSHRYDEARYRKLTAEFSRLLEERLESNRTQDVRDALSHVNNLPDEWSSFSRDQLERVREVTDALEKTAQPAVASKDTASFE